VDSLSHSIQAMKTTSTKTNFFLVVFLSYCVAISALASDAVDTNAPATAAEPAINLADIMRSYAEVQEQLRMAQATIESGRKEAAEAALRNAEIWSNRLAGIEKSLSDKRELELKEMRDANQTTLRMAWTFAGLGLVAMVLTSFMQWRAARRMSDVAASNMRALVPAGGWSMPLPADMQGAGEQAPVLNNRLLASIGQLEKLVGTLNHTATQPAKDVVISEPVESNGEKPSSDKTARITLLLSKGQSLLNMNQVEDAESCFDEVLQLDGNNTEALVKKGVALERQRKLNEAIECYDRAIAADSTMTIAYLYKGGVYNRLERFSEALDCYEKALHTQEKRRSN
jgi:tetratricopeptide (TPR) repeat protein